MDFKIFKVATFSQSYRLAFSFFFFFTIKPPYSIPIGKLKLAIWETSFWTFLDKFGHMGPSDISQDLFCSFLKYVAF